MTLKLHEPHTGISEPLPPEQPRLFMFDSIEDEYAIDAINMELDVTEDSGFHAVCWPCEVDAQE